MTVSMSSVKPKLHTFNLLSVTAAVVLPTVALALNNVPQNVENALSAGDLAKERLPVRCFAAYASYASSPNEETLAQACPAWDDWVSTDGIHADKVHDGGSVFILGQRAGNATTNRIGSIADAMVDLGGGFDNDLVPGGKSIGVHLLSISKSRYRSCCGGAGGSPSLADDLEAGGKNAARACSVLRDSVRGPLRFIGEYSSVKQARDVSQIHGFSQCYHQIPDVMWLHMHTTAGVKGMRSTRLALGPWATNSCVCEPAELGKTQPGRGNCPTAQPENQGEYVAQAVESLCLNIAGAAGLDVNASMATCTRCARGK